MNEFLWLVGVGVPAFMMIIPVLLGDLFRVHDDRIKGHDEAEPDEPRQKQRH